MGIGDMANKAKDGLNSDKGEQLTDQGLDRAQQTADDRVGEQHRDKVQQGRDHADDRIGKKN